MKKLLYALLVLCCLSINAFAQPGANDPTFNTFDIGFGYGDGANGVVRTTAVQPDGKIIIGGDFSSINGMGSNRIARLNSDGSLDLSFNPGTGANGTISATAVQSDGKIIIGGSFTTFNGTPSNRIARLNTDGSLDISFNPGTGANATVNNTAIQSDGKIIIGGSFTSFDGTIARRIARLNSDGVLDASFNPGTGPNDQVLASTIQPDGKIIIGGSFTAFNGTSLSHITRLNSDGSLDLSFNLGTGSNGWVYSVGVRSDGKILIGGAFTIFNGTPINRIARLNADGSLDMSFNPGAGANSSVRTTAIQTDGKIIIGGEFTDFNGTPINRIARLNLDGSIDMSFNPGTGPNSSVETSAIQSDGKITIGGNFTFFNDTGRNHVARLNADGSYDMSFNPGTGANSLVGTTAIQSDGKIIIGGLFTVFNGTPINRIARLNPDGSIDVSFNPGTGANGWVQTAAIQPDEKIIIGGEFTDFNGSVRNRIARLNADGSLDLSFDPGTGANNRVRTAVIQSDGKIIIGGDFTYVNGNSRNRIARLNADGSLDMSFNPDYGANNTVFSTAIQPDGKIIIGGFFNSYNGSVTNYIARLNADGSLDMSFNPGTGANNLVRTTTIQPDGKIIIGGGFNSINGIGSNCIARLNNDGSLDMSFNLGTGANDQVVTSSIQPDGKIMIGGWFNSYDGASINRIARLNVDGSLDMSFNPGSGANGPVFSNAIQSNGNIIIGGSFDAYDGTGRNRVARILNCSPTTGTDVIATCNSYTWIDGIEYTASNNTATYTLTNAAGCDSIVTLNLTIDTPVTSDVLSDLTACDSYELPTLTAGNYFTETNGGGTQLNAGDLVNTSQTVYVYAENGTCSDETSFTVTIDDPIQVDEQSDLTSCDFYELPALITGNYFTETNGGGTQLSAGDLVEATQTLYVYAENGTCSDETSFTVTINENPDNGISQNDLTLSANATGANYVWVDCNNAFAPIGGETGQSFTATENGSYAVEITENGCADTSACVDISTVQIIENDFVQQIKIFPNPTEGTFTIDLGSVYESTSITIKDAIGRIVSNSNYTSADTIQLSLDEPTGIYFIEIESGQNTAKLKLIKQ